MFSYFAELVDDLEKKGKDLKRSSIKVELPKNAVPAVNAIEYGHGKVPPKPFIRTAQTLHGRKWESMMMDCLVNSLFGGKIDPKKTFASVREQIRKDIYRSAVKMGVDEEIAALYKPNFKRNYRNVHMMEWRHGHPKKPRPYHEEKWDGHKGKINGKPNGLDGYIFPVDKPPVIDQETGVRGYPGNLPNCSCTMVPVTNATPNGVASTKNAV